MSAAPRPAGLYLHIPYCSAICPYCDFAVRTGRPEQRAEFVDRLIAEIGLWADWPDPMDTVYLGGGTPSILMPTELARILQAVRDQLPVRPQARITLEANPEDVNADRVAAWREIGVATLSLGVQSFDDEELGFLGRRHDRRQALGAVETCLAGGFSTVSLDLMFGLPGQTPATWGQNLATAVALAPQHISCYQLTVHEGTNFARRRRRGRLVEMPNDEQAPLLELTHRRLGDAGWQGYEVSNFASAPEHRSAHNLKYWHHTPYLGLGPGAHSFDGQRRWWNRREVAAYAAAVDNQRRPIDGSETLEPGDLALETLMLRLRTLEGIDLPAFRQRFGFDLVERNQRLIADCITHGQLRLADDRLQPTIRGLAVADGLAARFSLASGG